MSNPSSSPFDVSAYLPKSAREHSASERHFVENAGEGHLRNALERTHGSAQPGAACLAIGILANMLVAMTLGTGLVAPAHAQVVPKSLEQGGTDAALKQRKNTWTVGVAGGILSGTYMTFADELAQVLDDGDNLRILPIVTYGAASNLDDLLYLRGVDVVTTQSDVFEYFRTQRKTPNLANRIHYIIRLPVSEMHVLAAHRDQKHRGSARQEGQFRAGRKRFKPDRDDRLSASGCAGRAVADRQSPRRWKSSSRANLPRWCG